MIVKDVVVLQEAADDMAAGRTFYEQRESGVGDYFWDSLIAAIESLSIFSGIPCQAIWTLSHAGEKISLCHLLRYRR